MTGGFQASLINNLFEKTLAAFPSAAIVDSKGQALAMKCSDLVDLGTFPTAAQLSDHYLKMKDGDIVLLNDPFSGGSHLSSMTLVAAVEIPEKKRGKSQKLFFCSRVPFRPTLGSGKNIDDEGIRIPPAPMFFEGKVNEELIGILQQHPLCPDQFSEFIHLYLEKLKSARVKFLKSLEHLGFALTTEVLEEFHKISETKAISALDEISMGESKTELELPNHKAKLSVHLKSTEGKVHFDFAGTSSSDSLNLTDNATFGACAGALYSSLDLAVPMNHGTLKAIEVSTPKNSMVNASYPQPVFMGLTDGPSLIASMALKLIGDIDSRKQMAQSGLSQCSLELKFHRGTRYFEQLPVGVGASTEFDGESGLDPWRRSHLNPSIEAAERLFPVQIIVNSFRKKSGGNGLQTGGDGVSRKIQILEKAQISWRVFSEFKKNYGLNGGKTGSGPEVMIQLPGGETKSLSAKGSSEIPANSFIVIQSAGGGGFGEASEAET